MRYKQYTANQLLSSNSGTFKWSHQPYASRMLQINVVLHQDGHIKDIHARYEKGQPQKYGYYGQKCINKQLICEHGQYIKHISGCFSEQYLQCLAVVTSGKRLQTFGNAYLLELNEECDKFEFCLESQGYLGVLTGQNDQKGIIKLDCLMVKSC